MPFDPQVAALQRAVADLRAGRDASAEAALAGLLDGTLLGEPLPEALVPRALGLHAQALLGLDELDRARDRVFDAIRAARRAGDGDGVRQLRGLSERIHAGLVARTEAERRRRETARVADADLDALVDGAGDPREQILMAIRKADAEMDAGRPGLALAEAALARAEVEGGPREQVFALLCLTRAAPERAAALLERARTVADEADEQRLITAVAQAARAAGVEFEPYCF